MILFYKFIPIESCRFLQADIPNIENQITIKDSFEKAFNSLETHEQALLFLMACGYRNNELQKMFVLNTDNAIRQRIKRARKNLKMALEQQGITI